MLRPESFLIIPGFLADLHVDSYRFGNFSLGDLERQDAVTELGFGQRNLHDAIFALCMDFIRPDFSVLIGDS